MSMTTSEVLITAEESCTLSSFESSTPSNSLLNSRLTTKEQLKICCKPTYQTKRVKRKGAILILIWSFLLTSAFFFNESIFTGHDFEVLYNLQLVAGGLTLLIAGWIADVYFGRYKVICWSMWIMWAASMMATASSVVAQLVDSYNQVFSYASNVFTIIGTVGLGGFQANVIQFGIDQLHDASTVEVTSFIRWYVWCGYSSGFMIDYVLGCTPGKYKVLLEMLVISISISMALCSIFLFNHWLVKEPVTQNPFKLVYKVIKYAINNKHPRHRSAFTYCEDNLPSRIDYGKNKYGGPFTTEQVEDVKTFLRLVVIISVAGNLFGEVIATDILRVNMWNKFIRTHTMDRSPYMCYSDVTFKQGFIYCGAIAVPLYEFFIYPLFHRCLGKLNDKSQWKVVLGVLLLIATIITLMLFGIIARKSYLENNINNNTSSIHCVFYKTYNSTLSTSFDYRWMAIPYFTRSMSVLFLGIGYLEFIAAQAPYLMRGLIMGTAYGFFLLSGALGIAVNIPFTKRSSVWGTGIISCGFWYALLLLIIAITLGIAYSVILRWYKNRKREDVLPNEHIFAERYYTRVN